ncbi:Heparanase-like protein 3 [Hibiscus syriacus]|uniref:Heparanase-like protein 3 n=1 Tax=Hibiscus syriacus TaxID=106335 RepID=A0A6A2X2F8_HIBSY|nr:Heparanase-like protein 3 [Hibiscus syriacus]
MGSFCFWVCFVVLSFASSQVANATVEGTVFIEGKAAIGRIDEDFICATLDWWPPEKCDYGTCSWGLAGLLNMDFSNKMFLNAIRLGGSLQDKVIYGTNDNQQPCTPFVKDTSEMFGFTQGCLPMDRWDELNSFFQKSGAKVIFGLNALAGRTIQSNGEALGAWNYTNAESFIRYTVEKNHTIHGWELGNELSGSGVGTRVSADQYAADTAALQSVVENVYKNVDLKPLIIAPGGFYDSEWFKEYINKTIKSVDVVTHHIYNLGPGVDEHLVEKILDPSVLEGESETFSGLHNIIKSSPTSAVAWVGEAGGAYNSGHPLVTNAFVFSFWYLDQLGKASKYDTKTYCRQSLVGGNYGLLNTTNFEPNPDYYSALLWHRLMGRNVLSTSFNGTEKIRSYTHCAKQSKGITVLLINLDNSTTVRAKLAFNSTLTLRHMYRSRISHHKHRIHKTTIIKLPKGIYSRLRREEYHLTAKDGNLQSQTMLLNGKVLSVNSSGIIPPLEPLHVISAKPIMVAPLSIVFVHMPGVIVPACKVQP